MSSPYLILSLDGGGIRGILSSRILEHLESAAPGFLDRIDLFAGTSTGGLIALSIAAGRRPSELTEVYRRLGPKVFEAPARRHTPTVAGLTRAQHGNAQLAHLLHHLFGSMRMGDLQRKVLVSTFDLDSAAASGQRSWKPKFVHNFEDEGADDRDELVVDVALRTTAAPTHFPVYQGFVDGGVVANNPSMCALAQSLDDATGGQRLEDVWLLSVGTGSGSRYVEASDEDWGLMQWAPHLVPLMFEGTTGIVDYQCRRLLGARYLRINPTLPRAIGLGAVEEVPFLERVADAEDLSDAVRWLNEALGS